MDDTLSLDDVNVSTPSVDEAGEESASLSDLASSFFTDIFKSSKDQVSKSVGQAINQTVSQALAPTPDFTSKAATPGGAKRASAASASLPLLLVGGAVIAFVLLKR